MAFVLLISRMVNYRPGAIAPLLALMFALPVLLFEFKVGRDELHYRIIEHDFGPGSAHFAERDVSEEFERAVRAAWMSRPEPKPPLETVRDSSELLWSLQLDSVLGPHMTAIARHRHAATDKIDLFLRHYPDSRYAVNSLYLKARALDTRVDQQAFWDHKILRFYSDFPSEASRRSWRLVYENGRGTPMAAVALHRLALLDARAGEIESAKEWLRNLARDLDEESNEPVPAGGFLTPKPAEATLGISRERCQLEGGRLLDLLINNRDPLYGYEPLVRLLHFDPRDEHYRENLRALVERYPRAQISDNATLEIALAAPTVADRVALLESFAEEFPSGDAVPEALFRLGEACRELGEVRKARECYEGVIREGPESIWRRPAEEALHVLPPSPGPVDHSGGSTS
jgi:tetratricopeptide (TPR) repeat protein